MPERAQHYEILKYCQSTGKVHAKVLQNLIVRRVQTGQVMQHLHQVLHSSNSTACLRSTHNVCHALSTLRLKTQELIIGSVDSLHRA